MKSMQKYNIIIAVLFIIKCFLRLSDKLNPKAPCEMLSVDISHGTLNEVKQPSNTLDAVKFLHSTFQL